MFYSLQILTTILKRTCGLRVLFIKSISIGGAKKVKWDCNGGAITKRFGFLTTVNSQKWLCTVLQS